MVKFWAMGDGLWAKCLVGSNPDYWLLTSYVTVSKLLNLSQFGFLNQQSQPSKRTYQQAYYSVDLA